MAQEIHGYTYIHDSNSNLKYDYGMFNKYNGTLNNYGFNPTFKDLVETMTQISSNCSFELTVRNMGTQEGVKIIILQHILMTLNQNLMVVTFIVSATHFIRILIGY